MESNFVFTESGIVESVMGTPAATEGGNVTYDLKLQKRWDNDFTAFKENDVVLASINTLAENGKYYDMWLRVLSVNTVTNTITVVCYPDDEVPSKKNYPPCELARLIRWGNAVDEDRQSCWYISSSEGLLVWLDHVTKPIIDKTNYSLAMGKLPDALSFLFQDFPTANKRDGAFYAKWMMAASFQQIDYQATQSTRQETEVCGAWLWRKATILTAMVTERLIPSITSGASGNALKIRQQSRRHTHLPLGRSLKATLISRSKCYHRSCGTSVSTT